MTTALSPNSKQPPVQRTKSGVVADALARDIQRNAFGVNARLPTERELVEQYGVSRMTIRAAFDHLEERGYVQRAPGRGRVIVERNGHDDFDGGQIRDCLILLRSFDEREGIGSIPFIRHNNYFANTFLGALREEMKDECARFRFCHYREGSDPLEVLKKADLEQCKGAPVILMSRQLDDDQIRWIRAQGLIPVQIGPRQGIEPITRVDSNNIKGMYDATRHLLERGSRRILRYTPAVDGWPATDQRQGYEKAHQDLGVALDETLWMDATPYREDFPAAAAALAERKFDAIIVSNEHATDQVCYYLDHHGVKVPNDIAVIVYSRNASIPSFFNPPVTYVDEPFAEMGRAAGQLYKLEREHPDSTFTRLINPKLVVCGSCGG